MTATIAITPVELVEQIFVDMGIGPTEAMSMAGAFMTRATTAGLRLGTSQSVPPDTTDLQGRPMWTRNGQGKDDGTLDVAVEDGGVTIFHLIYEASWLTTDAARIQAAHLLAAADAADRQAAQTTTEEDA
ncbi:MAG: hypothetical protein ACLT2I_00475 [Corynebacterium variabile]